MAKCKFRVAILLVVPFLVFLAGCKPRSIVGTWIQDSDTKLKHELSFYSDNTYIDTVYKFVLAERVVVRGTYKYDGTTLNAKPKSASVENAGTYAEQRKREERLPKSIMDSDVGKIEWITDTSFRFTPDRDPKAAAVYVRKN